MTPSKITLAEYFGPYYGHKAITTEIRDNAVELLGVVNEVIALAAADGVQFEINPNTANLISGEYNGGWRPPECPIGAPLSKHKRGKGIDIYDLHRRFAAWCYKHHDILKEKGLSMERHEWTPSWCHLQDVPPGPPGSPWRLDFVPDATPPKCSPLPEQKEAV